MRGLEALWRKSFTAGVVAALFLGCRALGHERSCSIAGEIARAEQEGEVSSVGFSGAWSYFSPGAFGWYLHSLLRLSDSDLQAWVEHANNVLGLEIGGEAEAHTGNGPLSEGFTLGEYRVLFSLLRALCADPSDLEPMVNSITDGIVVVSDAPVAAIDGYPIVFMDAFDLDGSSAIMTTSDYPWGWREGRYYCWAGSVSEFRRDLTLAASRIRGAVSADRVLILLGDMFILASELGGRGEGGLRPITVMAYRRVEHSVRRLHKMMSLQLVPGESPLPFVSELDPYRYMMEEL